MKPDWNTAEHLVLSSDQAGNPKLISDRHVEDAEPPTLYVQSHRIVQVLKDLGRHVVQPPALNKGLLWDQSSALRLVIQSHYADHPIIFSCLLHIQDRIYCSITPLGIPRVCFFCQTMFCYSKLLCMFGCQKGQTWHCRFKAGTLSKAYTGHVECHATIFTFPFLYEVSLSSFFFF